MTMSLWSTPTWLPPVPFYNQTKAPSQSLEHSPASAQAPPRFDPHIGFVALSRSSAPSEWWAHGLVFTTGIPWQRFSWYPAANGVAIRCQGSQYVHPHTSTCGTSTSWQRLCNYRCCKEKIYKVDQRPSGRHIHIPLRKDVCNKFQVSLYDTYPINSCCKYRSVSRNITCYPCCNPWSHSPYLLLLHYSGYMPVLHHWNIHHLTVREDGDLRAGNQKSTPPHLRIGSVALPLASQPPSPPRRFKLHFAFDSRVSSEFVEIPDISGSHSNSLLHHRIIALQQLHHDHDKCTCTCWMKTLGTCCTLSCSQAGELKGSLKSWIMT